MEGLGSPVAEKPSVATRWCAAPGLREAYELSVVSAGVTLLAFVLGLVLSVLTHSPATLGYALENFVDLCSSGVVIWRFWGAAPPAVLEAREKRASVGIAIMMTILAVVVFSVALDHLLEAARLTGVHTLIALAVPSLVIFGVLSYLKFKFARVLKSPALQKDAICSFAGAVLSGGVLIGSLLFKHDESIYWVDGSVAIATGLVLGAYGLRTLVKNVKEGNRYWTLSWWRQSGGGRSGLSEKLGLAAAGPHDAAYANGAASVPDSKV